MRQTDRPMAFSLRTAHRAPARQIIRHMSSLVHTERLTRADRDAMRRQLQTQGFCMSPQPLLDAPVRDALKLRYEALFRGDFETGVYPDEWHWRAGLSLPNVTRESCNAYKSDRLIAAVVLNAGLAHVAADLQCWDSVRIGQDDVIWKPPAAVMLTDNNNTLRRYTRPQTIVGFHRDADYISRQFEPFENSSLTIWMALDDADEETGCLEYIPGSHLWRNVETTEESSSTLTFFSKEDSHRKSMPPQVHTKDIVYPKCPAGHVLFHHQDVWHGSGPNQSTVRHRRALVAHVLNARVTWRQSTASQGESSSLQPPWAGITYIYGRYRRPESLQLDDCFFPVLYAAPGSGLQRTPWLDPYVAKEVV